MSIFSKIKDAIFGHKSTAAPAPGQDPAVNSAFPGGASAGAGGWSGTATDTSTGTATAQPVDVEQSLTEIAAAKGNPDLNWRTSIVDLMKLLGLDSSLDHRKQLAQELGYTGSLDGSAEMNVWLHREVMRQLAANGGNVPASMLG